MQIHRLAMSGPEFLDKVADQHRANGLDLNAEAFSTRALEWAGDKKTIQTQAAELQDLRDRLADIARSAKVAVQ